jgi:hypothetical protein
MRKVSAGAACLLLSCNVVCAQSAIPERQVRGNTLLSERDPGVRIALPEQARHAERTAGRCMTWRIARFMLRRGR